MESSSDWIRDLAKKAPPLSVVIPCRQEEEHIERCLNAVLAQDVDAPFEVLVVDGMSTDRTREIVKETAARDARVRLLDNPRGIVPPAMNKGILEAKGAFVIRIDGHCRVPADYLRQVIHAFAESGAECVGGSMVAEGETYWGKVIAGATSTAFGMGGRRFHGRGEPRYMDTVYLGAYPKRVLLELGLYDEAFVRNQDDELNYRLRSTGGRVYFTPKIWAAYTTRATLGKLVSQYAQYGWWKVRLYRKHARLLRLRHLAPSGLVATLAATLAFAFWSGGAAWWLPAGLLASYLGAGALSLAYERAPLSRIPAILVVCGLIHMSYGVGFLGGLIYTPFSSSDGGSPVRAAE